MVENKNFEWMGSTRGNIRSIPRFIIRIGIGIMKKTVTLAFQHTLKKKSSLRSIIETKLIQINVNNSQIERNSYLF